MDFGKYIVGDFRLQPTVEIRTEADVNLNILHIITVRLKWHGYVKRLAKNPIGLGGKQKKKAALSNTPKNKHW